MVTIGVDHSVFDRSFMILENEHARTEDKICACSDLQGYFDQLIKNKIDVSSLPFKLQSEKLIKILLHCIEKENYSLKTPVLLALKPALQLLPKGLGTGLQLVSQCYNILLKSSQLTEENVAPSCKTRVLVELFRCMARFDDPLFVEAVGTNNNEYENHKVLIEKCVNLKENQIDCNSLKDEEDNDLWTSYLTLEALHFVLRLIQVCGSLLCVKFKEDLDFWLELLLPAVFVFRETYISVSRRDLDSDMRKAAREALDSLLLIVPKNEQLNLDKWPKIKKDIKDSYADKMVKLVGNASDWAANWCLVLDVLGAELTRKGNNHLINKLLNVEERAFKFDRSEVRIHAFICWRHLIDKLLPSGNEVASDSLQRSVRLLVQPLQPSNAKTDMMSRQKLNTWWHLVRRLEKYIENHQKSVLVPFLHYCFGSSKLKEQPAGKKFSSLHIPCAQALANILNLDPVEVQDYFSRKKEFENAEKCNVQPCSVPLLNKPALFLDLSEDVIYSVGECIVILSCNSEEVEPNSELLDSIWKSLLRHIKVVLDCGDFSGERTVKLVNDLLKMVQNLTERSSSSAPSLASNCLSLLLEGLVMGPYALPRNILSSSVYYVGTAQLMTGTPALFLIELLVSRPLLQLTSSHLRYIPVLKAVLDIGINNQNALEFIQSVMKQLEAVASAYSNVNCTESTSLCVVWNNIARVLITYLKEHNHVNQGNEKHHDLSCFYLVVLFPFYHLYNISYRQTVETVAVWRELYKFFHHTALRSITTLEINEVCETVALKMCQALSKHCPSSANQAVSLVKAVQSIIMTIPFTDVCGNQQSKSKSKFSLLPDRGRGTKPVNYIANTVNLVIRVSQLFPSFERSGEWYNTCGSVIMTCLEILFKNMKNANVAVAIPIVSSLSSPLLILLQANPLEDVTLKFWQESLQRMWKCYFTFIETYVPHKPLKEFLKWLSPVLEAGFRHSQEEIRNAAVLFWDNTALPALSEGNGDVPNTLKEARTKSSEKTSRTPDLPATASDNASDVNVNEQDSKEKPRESFAETVFAVPEEIDKNKDHRSLIKKLQDEGHILTKHQKEVFRRRKDDIPALYSSTLQPMQEDSLLSESSQDTSDFHAPQRIIESPKTGVNATETKEERPVPKTLKVLEPPSSLRRMADYRKKMMIDDEGSIVLASISENNSTDGVEALDQTTFSGKSDDITGNQSRKQPAISDNPPSLAFVSKAGETTPASSNGRKLNLEYVAVPLSSSVIVPTNSVSDSTSMQVEIPQSKSEMAIKVSISTPTATSIVTDSSVTFPLEGSAICSDSIAQNSEHDHAKNSHTESLGVFTSSVQTADLKNSNSSKIISVVSNSTNTTTVVPDSKKASVISDNSNIEHFKKSGNVDQADGKPVVANTESLKTNVFKPVSITLTRDDDIGNSSKGVARTIYLEAPESSITTMVELKTTCVSSQGMAVPVPSVGAQMTSNPCTTHNNVAESNHLPVVEPVVSNVEVLTTIEEDELQYEIPDCEVNLDPVKVVVEKVEDYNLTKSLSALETLTIPFSMDCQKDGSSSSRRKKKSPSRRNPNDPKLPPIKANSKGPSASPKKEPAGILPKERLTRTGGRQRRKKTDEKTKLSECLIQNHNYTTVLEVANDNVIVSESDINNSLVTTTLNSPSPSLLSATSRRKPRSKRTPKNAQKTNKTDDVLILAANKTKSPSKTEPDNLHKRTHDPSKSAHSSNINTSKLVVLNEKCENKEQVISEVKEVVEDDIEIIDVKIVQTNKDATKSSNAAISNVHLTEGGNCAVICTVGMQKVEDKTIEQNISSIKSKSVNSDKEENYRTIGKSLNHSENSLKLINASDVNTDKEKCADVADSLKQNYNEVLETKKVSMSASKGCTEIGKEILVKGKKKNMKKNNSDITVKSDSNSAECNRSCNLESSNTDIERNKLFPKVRLVNCKLENENLTVHMQETTKGKKSEQSDSVITSEHEEKKMKQTSADIQNQTPHPKIRLNVPSEKLNCSIATRSVSDKIGKENEMEKKSQKFDTSKNRKEMKSKHDDCVPAENVLPVKRRRKSSFMINSDLYTTSFVSKSRKSSSCSERNSSVEKKNDIVVGKPSEVNLPCMSLSQNKVEESSSKSKEPSSTEQTTTVATTISDVSVCELQTTDTVTSHAPENTSIVASNEINTPEMSSPKVVPKLISDILKKEKAVHCLEEDMYEVTNNEHTVSSKRTSDIHGKSNNIENTSSDVSKTENSIVKHGNEKIFVRRRRKKGSILSQTNISIGGLRKLRSSTSKMDEKGKGCYDTPYGINTTSEFEKTNGNHVIHASDGHNNVDKSKDGSVSEPSVELNVEKSDVLLVDTQGGGVIKPCVKTPLSSKEDNVTVHEPKEVVSLPKRAEDSMTGSQLSQDSLDIIESSQESCALSIVSGLPILQKCTVSLCRFDTSLETGNKVDVSQGDQKILVLKPQDPSSPFKVCTPEKQSPGKPSVEVDRTKLIAVGRSLYGRAKDEKGQEKLNKSSLLENDDGNVGTEDNKIKQSLDISDNKHDVTNILKRQSTESKTENNFRIDSGQPESKQIEVENASVAAILTDDGSELPAKQFLKKTSKDISLTVKENSDPNSAICEKYKFRRMGNTRKVHNLTSDNKNCNLKSNTSTRNKLETSGKRLLYMEDKSNYPLNIIISEGISSDIQQDSTPESKSGQQVCALEADGHIPCVVTSASDMEKIREKIVSQAEENNMGITNPETQEITESKGNSASFVKVNTSKLRSKRHTTDSDNCEKSTATNNRLKSKIKSDCNSTSFIDGGSSKSKVIHEIKSDENVNVVSVPSVKARSDKLTSVVQDSGTSAIRDDSKSRTKMIPGSNDRSILENTASKTRSGQVISKVSSDTSVLKSNSKPKRKQGLQTDNSTLRDTYLKTRSGQIALKTKDDNVSGFKSDTKSRIKRVMESNDNNTCEDTSLQTNSGQIISKLKDGDASVVKDDPKCRLISEKNCDFSQDVVKSRTKQVPQCDDTGTVKDTQVKTTPGQAMLKSQDNNVPVVKEDPKVKSSLEKNSDLSHEPLKFIMREEMEFDKKKDTLQKARSGQTPLKMQDGDASIDKSFPKSRTKHPLESDDSILKHSHIKTRMCYVTLEVQNSDASAVKDDPKLKNISESSGELNNKPESRTDQVAESHDSTISIKESPRKSRNKQLISKNEENSSSLNKEHIPKSKNKQLKIDDMLVAKEEFSKSKSKRCSSNYEESNLSVTKHDISLPRPKETSAKTEGNNTVESDNTPDSTAKNCSVTSTKEGILKSVSKPTSSKPESHNTSLVKVDDTVKSYNNENNQAESEKNATITVKSNVSKQRSKQSYTKKNQDTAVKIGPDIERVEATHHHDSDILTVDEQTTNIFQLSSALKLLSKSFASEEKNKKLKQKQDSSLNQNSKANSDDGGHLPSSCSSNIEESNSASSLLMQKDRKRKASYDEVSFEVPLELELSDEDESFNTAILKVRRLSQTNEEISGNVQNSSPEITPPKSTSDNSDSDKSVSPKDILSSPRSLLQQFQSSSGNLEQKQNRREPYKQSKGGRAQYMVGLAISEKDMPQIRETSQATSLIPAQKTEEMRSITAATPPHFPIPRKRLLYSMTPVERLQHMESSEHETPSPGYAPVEVPFKRVLKMPSSDGQGTPPAKKKRVSFSEPVVSETNYFTTSHHTSTIMQKKAELKVLKKAAKLRLEKKRNSILQKIPVSSHNSSPTSPLPMNLCLKAVPSPSQSSPDLTGITSQGSIEESMKELLNSQDPVFPALVNCTHPIENIAPKLTTHPMWIKALITDLNKKRVITIGDLSRLDEASIDRLPIAKPKIFHTRRILQEYLSSLEEVVEEARLQSTTGHTSRSPDDLAGDKGVGMPSSDSRINMTDVIKFVVSNKGTTSAVLEEICKTSQCSDVVTRELCKVFTENPALGDTVVQSYLQSKLSCGQISKDFFEKLFPGDWSETLTNAFQSFLVQKRTDVAEGTILRYLDGGLQKMTLQSVMQYAVSKLTPVDKLGMCVESIMLDNANELALNHFQKLMQAVSKKVSYSEITKLCFGVLMEKAESQ